MKTTYTIAVAGLQQLVERHPEALGVALALGEPLQRLAAGVLQVLLPDADVTCANNTIQDRLSATGWPKWWRSSTMLRAVVPGKGVLSAEVVIHHDRYDGSARDFWKASIAIPDLPLLLGPDVELRIELARAQSGALCTLVACSVPDEAIPAIASLFGTVFGGTSAIVGSERCDWRPPPDQPAIRYEVEVPDFAALYRRADPQAELDEMKRPVQRLATAMLGVTVPGQRVELHPFVALQKTVGDDAMLTLQSQVTTTRGGPAALIRLEYCSIMNPNSSFEIVLDRYLPEWSARGVFSLRYDSRDAEVDGGIEHLTVLQSASFPARWKEQLVAGIGRALDRPCRITHEQPIMLRPRLREEERRANHFSDDGD